MSDDVALRERVEAAEARAAQLEQALRDIRAIYVTANLDSEAVMLRAVMSVARNALDTGHG